MKRGAPGSSSAAGSGPARLVVGWGVLPQRSRLGSPQPHATARGRRRPSTAGSRSRRTATFSAGDASAAKWARAYTPRIADAGCRRAGCAAVGDAHCPGQFRHHLRQRGPCWLAGLPFHPLDEARRKRLWPHQGQPLGCGQGRARTGHQRHGRVRPAWQMHGKSFGPAAATARASLLGAASLQWRLPVAEPDPPGLAWSPTLRGEVGKLRRTREVRGSHAAWRGGAEGHARAGPLIGQSAPRADVAVPR